MMRQRRMCQLITQCVCIYCAVVYANIESKYFCDQNEIKDESFQQC